MKSFGFSHKGKIRPSNQDAYFIHNEKINILQNLYIAADGMGGHSAGEIASSGAIDAFVEYLRNNVCNDIPKCLEKAADYANKFVYKNSLRDLEFEGMGTTFTAFTLSPEKEHCVLHAVHIGDTCIYTMNSQGMVKITTDHTYVNEMINLGRLSPEEAQHHPGRHILTRALGTDNEVIADIITLNINYGVKILLCSDGLTNMVSDEDIHQIVISRNIEQAVYDLTDLANKNGGVDNITSILVDLVEI